MTVRLTLEPLPPLYAVRAVRWGDGTPAGVCYIAGFLTEERRAAYVAANGWRVVE